MVLKFNYLICIIAFLAVLPCGSYQQGRYSRNKATEEDKKAQEYAGTKSNTEDTTHWKSVAIVVFGVMFLAAICYGTNCFWVCQFAFCDNPYTKMDRMSHV